MNKAKKLSLPILCGLSMILGACDQMSPEDLRDLPVPEVKPEIEVPEPEDLESACDSEQDVTCDDSTACWLENAISGEFPGINECVQNCYQKQLLCMHETAGICEFQVQQECKTLANECIHEECVI